MSYPGYLGNLVHVAFLTYPLEGAEVQINLTLSGSQQPAQQTNVSIAAGIAPVAFNISCPACYSSSYALSVTAASSSDPSRVFDMNQDTVAVTSLKVTDGWSSTSPAQVSATFSGLDPSENYNLTLWCNAPNESYGAGMTGSDATISFSAYPGVCKSTRYLALVSADGIHAAVGIAT